MTHRLSDNLRSGHRAEDLAIVLLKQVGAVAQIPHTEDVGSDAIVTLLPRSDDNTRTLMSTHSFWVQVKTSSTVEVSFDHEQARWLKNLELPFFIARMDSQETKIKIFSPHLLWDIYAVGQHHSAPSSHPDTKMTLRLHPREGDSGWGYLGPPFVEWRFHEIEGLAQRTERDEIVSIFEDWCLGWQRARLLWLVGVSLIPDYESGERPHRWRSVKRFTSDHAELCRIALESLAHLEALLGGLALSGDMETPRTLLLALQRLCSPSFPELEGELERIREALTLLSPESRPESGN